MKYDYHIIVIGAGSGGLVVASGAAGIGAKVALIEKNKMGGDCLNTGCVPSKTFLKSAHIAKNILDSKKFGIDSKIEKIDINRIMNRVKNVIKEIEPHDSTERYESLGVDVINGSGKFINSNTVEVNNQKITGKNIVIATGSTAFIPEIKGLTEISYLTNENIFDITKLPKSLIILGAGPIGMELGQGFRYLGSNVTIVDKGDKLFTKDDKEVSKIMETQLLEDGINLELSAKIIEVKKGLNNKKIVVIEKNNNILELVGDEILVALGRKPSVKSIGIDTVGIKLNNKGFVVTNDKLQTNIKNIYACGDVTGPYLFTHMASYQAGIIIANTIFRIGRKVDYSKVSWTTYTQPEIAHIGYTEDLAVKKGLYKESVVVNIDSIDRAKSEDDRTGFIKIILDEKSVVIGATIVSEKAGELIPQASIAVNQKLKLSIFMNIIYSYPTIGEGFKFAALKKAKENFKEWQKKIVKLIFLR